MCIHFCFPLHCRYFTWDPVKFPDSLDMIKNLTDRGRKLVTIVDPHMKRDPSYFFHQTCEQEGFYIKDKDGKIYEGWCWPGSSSYPDFLNPAVRDYWASRYALDKYQGELTFQEIRVQRFLVVWRTFV